MTDATQTAGASPEGAATLRHDEILGHPKGLFILFFTEMWERFSYYGMRALLILYLTKHFLFDDKSAGLLYGSYTALVYAMPVLGGMIGDRYLGHRKATALGAILLVCGHLGMAIEGPPNDFYQQTFYLSLAFIVIGVGFLKASISTMVGELYGANDPRRDAGFTIFYMGINIGAFVATLACAYLGETYGWRYGFGLAGIGMLVGLVTFIRGKPHLQGAGEPPNPAALALRPYGLVSKETLIYLLAVASVLVIWQLLQRTGEVGLLLAGFGLAVVGWVCWYSLARCGPLERNRMLVMLLLILVSVFFWALFEQAGSSLTLFTDRNVNLADNITAGMFQSLNPLFIILLAPGFAWLWVKLAARRREPSTPMKFGLGILQVGLGFAVLVFGASLAGEDGRVAMIWLALMYLLHTTGELCLSPVGLAMVTRLSVAQVAGMMMGVWFLSSSFAAYVAGMVAGAMAIDTTGDQTASATDSLAIYVSVFGKLALVAVAMGLLLMLVSPLLARLIAGDAHKTQEN
ncbi:MAG: peptide MFS transporter [Pseudomonadales bacterium]